MQTISGIDISLLTRRPTPEELGSIVARWNCEKQAEFFSALGEKLRNCCGGGPSMQWQAIADRIKRDEEVFLDGSAAELIRELSSRLESA